MKEEEFDKEMEFMDLEDEEGDVPPRKAASARSAGSVKRHSDEDYEEDFNEGREEDYSEGYGEDYAEDYEEDDWQEEPMKPWKMALVFLALVILAAVICALLWRFTHGADRQVPDNDSMGGSVVTSSADPVQESQEPAPEPTSELTEAPTEGPGEEPTVSPEPEQTPTVSASIEPVTTVTPQDQPVQDPTDGDVSMPFDSVQESVTPKDVINLRSVPSTADENTIVVQSLNGEVLSRTGVNANTGWSRIDYNGQTLYAVTQYLTTDLSYKPPVQPSNPNRVTTASGRVIIFTDCDDQLTPKEYVNLRTEPSTSEGDATVRCQVSNGEAVHRTGYSPDYGWSRVEYNGEVLYVVTSLMQAL